MNYKYKFKTKPYKHQNTALDLAGQRPSFGFFMEMGTGKSKVLIDNMGMLRERQVRWAYHLCHERRSFLYIKR